MIFLIGGDVDRPDWIRSRVSWEGNSEEVRGLLGELGLHTVCIEAACPNKCECWKDKHVTFIILGNVCTRGCLFCNVNGGDTEAPASREPLNIARAIEKLGKKYVVITSVTRDDLEDGGVSHFDSVVKEIRGLTPDVKVELLIPDFKADKALLKRAVDAGADVIGHNIEMPANLYQDIRPKAEYRKSLKTLNILKELKDDRSFVVKSSLIIGLGETEDQIITTLQDLKNADVDIVYIGQYLSPTKKHWPVKRYYTVGEFDCFAEKAKNMGFKVVLSGPMVRSSYRAAKSYEKVWE